MNEYYDFHPQVATWLTENGYTYQHEVKMPEYGRADFVATHADGQRLIIECKVETNVSNGRSIIQLLDYCRQMPQTRPAFAIPIAKYTDYISNLCNTYDVQLILIPTETPLDVVLQQKLKRPKPANASRLTRNKIEQARIINEARVLIQNKGLKEFSLRGLAKHLNFTPANLYHYFSSEKQVFHEIAYLAADSLLDNLHRVTETTQNQKIVAIISAFCDWVESFPHEFHLIFGTLSISLSPSDQSQIKLRMIRFLADIIFENYNSLNLLEVVIPSYYQPVVDAYLLEFSYSKAHANAVFLAANIYTALWTTSLQRFSIGGLIPDGSLLPLAVKAHLEAMNMAGFIFDNFDHRVL
jgi:AcrR family transcriptional regulator